MTDLPETDEPAPEWWRPACHDRRIFRRFDFTVIDMVRPNDGYDILRCLDVILYFLELGDHPQYTHADRWTTFDLAAPAASSRPLVALPPARTDGWWHEAVLHSRLDLVTGALMHASFPEAAKRMASRASDKRRLLSFEELALVDAARLGPHRAPTPARLLPAPDGAETEE